MKASQLSTIGFALVAPFAVSACGDGGLRERLNSFDRTVSHSLSAGNSVEFSLAAHPDVRILQTSSSISCTGGQGRSASYEEIPVGGELKIGESVHTILPYDIERVDQIVVGVCTGDVKGTERAFVAQVDNPASGF